MRRGCRVISGIRAFGITWKISCKVQKTIRDYFIDNN